MTDTERAAAIDAAAARHPSAWKRTEEALWAAVIAAPDLATREAASRDYIDHHLTRTETPHAA